MAKTNRYKTSEVIAAIEDASGIMTQAAALLGCSRSTVYRYVERYPTVKASYEEQTAVIVEKAYGKLLEHVFERDSLPALFFLLRTKGKKHGFTYQVEDESEDKDVTIDVQIVDQERARVFSTLADALRKRAREDQSEQGLSGK